MERGGGRGQARVVLDHEDVILIGLGANLPGPKGSSPRETLEQALICLPDEGIAVCAVSPFYRTAPVPPSDQPRFVNAVAAVESALSPVALMAALHRIEASLGRTRRERWEARVIDLDLLAAGGTVLKGEIGPELPHPRLSGRAFVLYPLRDVAPGWHHPVTGEGIDALIARLPPDQAVERLDGPP